VTVAVPRTKSRLRVVEKFEMTLSFLIACSVTVRPDVAAPLALMWIARRYCSGRERHVVRRDVRVELLGQRGVELPVRIVAGDVLVQLGRGDLREVEVVAHDTSTVLVPGKPRPTWALI
jgi:hypothetical protein